MGTNSTQNNKKVREEVEISVIIDNKKQLELLAQTEKLRLLYQQSFPAILASLVTAVLICVVLWKVQDKAVLLAWFAILFTSAIARFVLFVGYWRQSPQGLELLAWEKPYFLTLLASSLIWGLGIVLIIHNVPQLQQIVAYFFLIGMGGGAIAVYSAHRTMTLATISSVLIPITLWFAFQGTLISSVLVVGVLLFFVSCVKAGAVLSATMHQSFYLTHELKDARDAAERLARRDELTGLNNRRAFYEQGQAMLEDCAKSDAQLAMIISDVDHFKKINDTWGHSSGDKVLQAIADVHKRCLGDDALCARLGGEEFGVLLLVTKPEHACDVAESLRVCLMETQIDCGEGLVSVTASFGVALGETTLEALFRQADAALYRAKELGRNRVVCGEVQIQRSAT